MSVVLIRRGYGSFVRVKNTMKARRRAAHWKRKGHGDQGVTHPVIGMFIGGAYNSRHRIELYP